MTTDEFNEQLDELVGEALEDGMRLEDILECIAAKVRALREEESE